MSDMEPIETMRLVDAAEALGLSSQTVRRMLEAGVLDGVETPGGHRRAIRASVEAYYATMYKREGAVDRAK